ncbi:MAG: hypothetical protein STSR0009_01540 [Methanoregula sp.]
MLKGFMGVGTGTGDPRTKPVKTGDRFLVRIRTEIAESVTKAKRDLDRIKPRKVGL